MPYTDLSTVKQRPALVVSNDAYNAAVEDIIVCGITSNLDDQAYSVPLGQEDMAEGTLHFTSRIKVDKLVTVHKARVACRLGQVSSRVLLQAKMALRQLLA
jgi:mRNA-degrading endonuclease toxin of MazEF toxin-antitoxin module